MHMRIREPPAPFRLARSGAAMHAVLRPWQVSRAEQSAPREGTHARPSPPAVSAARTQAGLDPPRLLRATPVMQPQRAGCWACMEIAWK